MLDFAVCYYLVTLKYTKIKWVCGSYLVEITML